MWVGRHFLLSRSQGRQSAPPAGARSAALPLLAAAVLGAGLLLVLTGCARVSRPAAAVEPATPLVWPEPPQPARIAYSRSVWRPADLGISRSAFTRFGQWLTGSDKGNEPLLKPFGIALDESDNLCVTDTGASAVCYYDRTKKKWHRWTQIGSIRFVSPVAVARQRDLLFVADSGLGRVITFDASGRLRGQITNRLERPAGLAISNGRLCVADSLRHCIVVFDLQGGFLAEFGRRGDGPGEFNFPTHLAADVQGHLLVTDSMNSRVQILDGSGRFVAQVGQMGDSPGQFSRPKGVATDSFGHVYVIDALFDNVQIFDRSGRFLLAFGGAGSAAGEFWLPNGIAISRNNEIYVADSYNRRLQIFKYIGPS
jgi:DNA-binding beta-propeller fold protein YncE